MNIYAEKKVFNFYRVVIAKADSCLQYGYELRSKKIFVLIQRIWLRSTNRRRGHPNYVTSKLLSEYDLKVLIDMTSKALSICDII